MKTGVILLILAVTSFGGLCMAPFFGIQSISLANIMSNNIIDPEWHIFWQIRLPRVCTAWLAGTILATCGLLFQALFRNPLTTPFTLGISSGASLGAALCIRFGFVLSLLNLSTTSLCAFLGALASTFLVYGIGRVRKNASTNVLLLAGVAVNFFFSSMILLIQYSSNYIDTFRILRWTMGGLDMVGMDAVYQMLPGALICITTAFCLVDELNLLCCGEDIAVSRGLSLDFTRSVLFVSVSFGVGLTVSLCGPIGFVGLMCPHLCRMIIGNDHRKLVPATVMFGGAFLVGCDTLARTVFAPSELPVGIVTALLGGPFFLFLLLRPSKSSLWSALN